MYHPTTRVLTVLELLQSHRSITGSEIAERLEVDIRTVRRYISMLDELGIPVTAERGRFGGYSLMPGYKLPPLMFNEDEALALVLGLNIARRYGMSAGASGIEGALAKIERVLPARIRDRVNAVDESLAIDPFERGNSVVEPSIVLDLGTAVRENRQVHLRYRSMHGNDTERGFDTYGLACRKGRWYSVGYCHLRKDIRLFRLDRVRSVDLLTDRFEKPESFDTLSAVLDSLGSVPKHFPIEVEIETTLENARRHISAEVATLEELPCGTVLLKGFTHDPAWMARLLASLGKPITIRQPDELRTALINHAHQITIWAANTATYASG